jgi:hypothetical protein
MGKKLALYCGRAMVEKRRQISQIHLPEDPVFGTRYFTTCVFLFFFSMVVPGTKCSQKKFGKFFGLKKGDLVPG